MIALGELLVELGKPLIAINMPVRHSESQSVPRVSQALHEPVFIGSYWLYAHPGDYFVLFYMYIMLRNCCYLLPNDS